MRTEHVILQAGQLAAEGVGSIAVFRTLAEEDGPRATLLVRAPGSEETLEAVLAPGEAVDLEDGISLGLLAMAPSTRERRGWARIVLDDRAEDPEDA